MKTKQRFATVLAVLLSTFGARAEPERSWYEENDSVEEVGTRLPPPKFDLFCLQGGMKRRLTIESSAHGTLSQKWPGVKFQRQAAGGYLAVMPPESCETLAAAVEEVAQVLAVEEIEAQPQKPFALMCGLGPQQVRLNLRSSAASYVVLSRWKVQLSRDGAGYFARSAEQCEAFADVWEVAQALAEQHYPGARFQMFCAHGGQSIRLDVPFTAAASLAKKWPLLFAVSRHPTSPPLGHVEAVLPRGERCETFAADVAEVAQALVAEMARPGRSIKP